MRTARERASAVAIAAGLSFALTACAALEIGGHKATLTYTDDARAAYNEAMTSFRAKEWEDAKVLFGEVRRIFAYSHYARLAELRIADIDFEQEKFSEAITAYREFIQNHRNDPDVEYARYRLTRALFLDTDDTILLPPAEERDQALSTDAYKELRSFLREFGKSRYAGDVRYMLEIAMGRLVRHELYVARFYLRDDLFEATIARIDHALKLYADSSMWAEAMVLKGETLMKMKKPDEAREVFDAVIKRGGPFAKPAKNFIAELDQQSKTGRAK